MRHLVLSLSLACAPLPDTAPDAAVPPDASLPDAAVPDAAAPHVLPSKGLAPPALTVLWDAGQPDAATLDAGVPDAATPDAAPNWRAEARAYFPTVIDVLQRHSCVECHLGPASSAPYLGAAELTQAYDAIQTYTTEPDGGVRVFDVWAPLNSPLLTTAMTTAEANRFYATDEDGQRVLRWIDLEKQACDQENNCPPNPYTDGGTTP